MNTAGIISAIVLSLILVSALVAVQPAQSQEIETRMYIGLWTEHYVEDNPEFNEENEIIQLSAYTEDDWFVTIAKFSNSHYVDSKLIGVGREFQGEYIDGLSWGVMLAAVHGYEGDIETHYDGLIFAPISYYKYKAIKAIIVGPVVNVGVEFKF